MSEDENNYTEIIEFEDSILISEESPAFEEGSLRFDLVYHENNIPINNRIYNNYVKF